MAYLTPEFGHDVFVSYSHGDFDGSGQSKLKVWSLRLKAALEGELRVKPGFTDAAIFIDNSNRADNEHSLDPANPLTAQLRDAAERAALLLVLMSQHYCKSGWCADERRWWIEKDKTRRFSGAEQSRLLIARVWPTGDTPWPPEILDERGQAPLGWTFFEPPGHPLTTVPFGWTDFNDARFAKVVTDLGGAIALRLDALKEAIERARRAFSTAGQSVKEVYLQGRTEDRQRWETAYEALHSAGLKVVPVAPETILADPDQKREREIAETLSDCDCALFVPSHDPISMTWDLKNARRRRNHARSIVPKSLPFAALDDGIPAEWRQRARETAEDYDIGWIEASRADWAESFRSWAARGGPPA